MFYIFFFQPANIISKIKTHLNDYTKCYKCFWERSFYMSYVKRWGKEVGVVHAFKPRSWDGGHPGLHKIILSQKPKIQKETINK